MKIFIESEGKLMKAIRGATTVNSNTKEEINYVTKILMDKIVKENDLTKDDIVSIIFTATGDITAGFPAAAIRETEFSDCPMMCGLEMNVEGSLQKCIRVMVHVNKDLTPVHIYLKGARILRKDLIKPIKIAIDGPAGAGKSSIAKMIAQRNNFVYIDTGAMFRAMALAGNVDNIAEKLQDINIDIKYNENKEQLVFLNNEDVTNKIRTPEISKRASDISKIKEVREKLLILQRKLAENNNSVMDGRDIGTVVLPDADVKIFLTASLDERSKRRYLELKEKNSDVPLDDVKQDIQYRDNNDSTRKNAPLMQAVDAILLDTSNMTIDEVYNFINGFIITP